MNPIPDEQTGVVIETEPLGFRPGNDLLFHTGRS
jgi:hypothetical protein